MNFQGKILLLFMWTLHIDAASGLVSHNDNKQNSRVNEASDLVMKKCCPLNPHLNHSSTECITVAVEPKFISSQNTSISELINIYYEKWFPINDHEVALDSRNNFSLVASCHNDQPGGEDLRLAVQNARDKMMKIVDIEKPWVYLLTTIANGSQFLFADFCQTRAGFKKNDSLFLTESATTILILCVFDNCSDYFDANKSRAYYECFSSEKVRLENTGTTNATTTRGNFCFLSSEESHQMCTQKEIRSEANPSETQDFDKKAGEGTDLSEGRGHTLALTTAYPICCTVSNVFLLITFGVYLVLPDLRRPLFGKLIMSFTFSLFVAYFLLSAIGYSSLIKLVEDEDEMEFYSACKILGFLALFFFLHTFFLMNVLSYEIYRKFTRFKNLAQRPKESQRVRLLKYYAYAICAPLLVTVITMIVEFLPDTYENLIRPEFGHRNCFFYSHLANFLYFHLHLILIQIANMIFFILTVKNLHSSWRTTQRMGQRHSGKKKKGKNENFKVIAKLFVVMGVTWMSELISFILGWVFDDDVIWKYLFFNDVINLSQGILIFLVLICKRSVYVKLKQKFLLHKNDQLAIQDSNQAPGIEVRDRVNPSYSEDSSFDNKSTDFKMDNLGKSGKSFSTFLEEIKQTDSSTTFSISGNRVQDVQGGEEGHKKI